MASTYSVNHACECVPKVGKFEFFLGGCGSLEQLLEQARWLELVGGTIAKCAYCGNEVAIQGPLEPVSAGN